ncbi:START domain-containing protein [Marinobacter sp. TBZ242]|uniref:START domain-containing protein n=1 Tax=Marinobacter azerbaijanicus TaxID=3050455 RepID=A0ABT7I9Y4_9GAMM|nr:START domain-containing protein [Marinobacter sp. TBZ242]MDL0430602.1 START domain-containing protein [Marinobacter sp. TBZ242]
MQNLRAPGISHRACTLLAVRWMVMVASVMLSAMALAELPDEDAEGWSLRKETDNIQVFTIDQPDSSFQAFKAEAVLDVPIENVMAVMVNPQSCVEWVHNCSESYAFGDGDFHDRYAYSVNNMPWPVTDRDYVIRIRTRGNPHDGEVVMELNAIPDERNKESDYIRVDKSDTLYRFIPEGDQTRMIWVQHTDPNGSIPGWLVNTLLVDIPVRSMKQLERVAGWERYQNHELVYDQEGRLKDVVPKTQTGDD